ncbi:hypothetical protein D5F89_07130 [Streptococcus agalactiae]|nr:hypothetical protein D5F89_07130 [Streptococcus agalactiae]
MKPVGRVNCPNICFFSHTTPSPRIRILKYHIIKETNVSNCHCFYWRSSCISWKSIILLQSE